MTTLKISVAGTAAARRMRPSLLSSSSAMVLYSYERIGILMGSSWPLMTAVPKSLTSSSDVTIKFLAVLRTAAPKRAATKQDYSYEDRADASTNFRSNVNSVFGILKIKT